MIVRTIPIWLDALIKPSAETFEKLYHSEAANMRSALVWLMSATVLSTIINTVGRLLLPYHPLRQLANPTATGSLSTEQARQIAESMQWLANPWLWLFAAPIMFLVMIFATHVTAQAVGGQGEMGRYGYVVSAIQSPIGLLTALLSWVPFLGQCSSTLISVGFYIYVVIATKAAYKLSTGKAIIAVLVPFGLFVVLVGCFSLFSVTAALTNR